MKEFIAFVIGLPGTAAVTAGGVVIYGRVAFRLLLTQQWEPLQRCVRRRLRAYF
jgi:hypothetical protein